MSGGCFRPCLGVGRGTSTHTVRALEPAFHAQTPLLFSVPAAVPLPPPAHIKQLHLLIGINCISAFPT